MIFTFLFYLCKILSRYKTMAIKVIKEQDDDIYAVTCEYCGCVFEYQIEDLGYRPWYPHGFVYCPNCKKPLRHKKEYKKSSK